MLFLDLAKAYDSVEHWALEDAMRGLGVPEGILTLKSADMCTDIASTRRIGTCEGADRREHAGDRVDRAAKGGSTGGGRVPTEVHILLVHDGEGEGYSTEEITRRETEERYAGQAFCDDGLFVAENNRDLQVLWDKVSAFCELYQVKINSGKSYCAVDRGKQGNKTARTHWVAGSIRLWDHTAAGGDGEWQAVT